MLTLTEEESLKIDLGEIPKGWIEVIPEDAASHVLTRKFKRVTTEDLERWLTSRKGPLPQDRTERIRVKTERVAAFMSGLDDVTEHIPWGDYCHQECERMNRNGLTAVVLTRRSSPSSRPFLSVIRKGAFNEFTG